MSKHKFTREQVQILIDGGFTDTQINDMYEPAIDLNRWQLCLMEETLKTIVKVLNTFELKPTDN